MGLPSQSIRVLVATALVSFTWLGTALAEDGKIYNGNECRPYWGSQTSDFVSHAAGLYNMSASDRWVVCPIIKDNVFGTSGTNDGYVFVSRSPLATTNLTCTLHAMNYYGATIDSQSRSFDYSSSSAGKILLNVSSSGRSGYYGLLCSLPTRSTIRSYRFDEN